MKAEAAKVEGGAGGSGSGVAAEVKYPAGCVCCRVQRRQ